MVEIDLAKELVTNRNMVQKLQDEMKVSKGTIKDLVEREDEIIKELDVRFSDD
jgi:hypothetical protein